MLFQAFNTIIDCGLIAPGHGKEVVGILNNIDKRFIFHVISTVQLPVSKRFDAQMVIHT